MEIKINEIREIVDFKLKEYKPKKSQQNINMRGFSEEDWERDLFENCNTHSEAKKWIKKYCYYQDLIFDKETLKQAFLDLDKK